MSDPMRHHASSSSFVLSIENQKYQIQQKKRTKTPQGSPSKRPPRACRAKTPSRLAPLAPSVQRSTPRTQNRATRHGIRSCDKNINGNAGNGDGHVGISAGKEGIVIRSGGGSIPMVLVPTPASPDQNPVCFLRRMWELASILHFMNVSVDFSSLFLSSSSSSSSLLFVFDCFPPIVSPVVSTSFYFLLNSYSFMNSSTFCCFILVAFHKKWKVKTFNFTRSRK